MALEYVALGALVINLILVVVIAMVFFKKGKKKVDPLEAELVEHADPEKLLLMKMVSGDKIRDDAMMRTVMRDMLHKQREEKTQKSEGGALVGEYVKEHGDHEGFLHDKQKIREEIKTEIKSDLRDAVRREIRKKLNS